MASYTTSLRLVQPSTGEFPGIWGSEINTGFTALVDKAVAGTASITMTAADYTLTNANGVADEAKSMFLVLGGTPGASYQVICPAVSKLYFVTNSTGFAQTVKTSGGSGISVPNGARMTLRCDGTNVLEAENYFGSLTLGAALPVASGGTGSTSTTYCSLTANVTGTLPVGNGGTGATGLTANNVLLGNGTSALQVVAPGTNGNVLTSNGTTWTSVAPASTVSLSANNTWTGKQTFNGTTSTLAAGFYNATEVTTISATAATGTINYDLTTQSVLYYTSNAAANWTVNFRASSGTSLNTAMATGESVTVAFLVTQGSTAYYNSAVQVDGSSVTPKWQGGSAPTSGNVSGIDAYTYTIIKTGAATFTGLAAQTRFA